MQYPYIDPVAFSIGPLHVRWYGISYVVGILLAWVYCRYLSKRVDNGLTTKHMDDFVIWATIGVVAGGRLGEALFYMPTDVIYRPWEILYLWRPGMSFHGGLLGVTIAGIWFCHNRKISYLAMADVLSMAAPIGLFFGRIANFINGELFGHVTDVSWGVVFPDGGPLPRHPSQLYEAALEGLGLFLLLMIIEHTTKWRRDYPGLVFGMFFIGYACARIFVETYRVPDAVASLYFFDISVGRLLSVPLLLVGLGFIFYSLKHKRA